MLKNPILQQAIEGIEQGVRDREVHDKVVKAGTQVLYAKETFAKLIDNIDPDENLVDQAIGAVMLVLTGLADKARGTLTAPSMVTAGMALTLDAIDFLEQAGMLKVDNSTLDEATTKFLNQLLPKLGMTPAKMGEVLEQVKGTMADPRRMQQYQQQGGK
jgi:hypothetical protein